MMDVDRAKEILDSSQKINVYFQGEPIWIEEVYERTDTALVHTESDPKNSKHVKVAELNEQ